MKLMIRADDFGYTVTHNDGTFKAINEGVITHVDIMLDTPGTDDALNRIKDYPWISMGWHNHFWGKPVLDPSLVPSMVNEGGKFKWRKDKHAIDTIDYDECMMEMRAQMDKCFRLSGRVPDTGNVGFTNSTFERATKAICDEYGIAYNFASGCTDLEMEMVFPLNEKYAGLNIFFGQLPEPNPGAYMKNIALFETHYDPAKKVMSFDVDKYNNAVIIFACHPGYLDDYVLAESTCTIARVKDVQAMCDPELKDWITRNNIELINSRDMLLGTREYQNYLKVNGSKLLHKRKTGDGSTS